jgi:hypothetical protein
LALLSAQTAEMPPRPTRRRRSPRRRLVNAPRFRIARSTQMISKREMNGSAVRLSTGWKICKPNRMSGGTHTWRRAEIPGDPPRGWHARAGSLGAIWKRQWPFKPSAAPPRRTADRRGPRPHHDQLLNYSVWNAIGMAFSVTSIAHSLVTHPTFRRSPSEYRRNFLGTLRPFWAL